MSALPHDGGNIQSMADVFSSTLEVLDDAAEQIRELQSRVEGAQVRLRSRLHALRFAESEKVAGVEEMYRSGELPPEDDIEVLKKLIEVGHR